MPTSKWATGSLIENGVYLHVDVAGTEVSFDASVEEVRQGIEKPEGEERRAIRR
jgi:hypothetical protein